MALAGGRRAICAARDFRVCLRQCAAHCGVSSAFRIVQKSMKSLLALSKSKKKALYSYRYRTESSSVQRSPSWPRLIAMGLTITAFAMDQALWVWSGQLQSVCFHGKNPHGAVAGNLYFAAPFLMLLAGQICLWPLPRSRSRDKFYLILGAVLLGYIAFSAVGWHETAYLDATADELSSCLNDVLDEYELVPAILHLLLRVPCGVFLVAALIAVGRYRLNRRTERDAPTDSPR